VTFRGEETEAGQERLVRSRVVPASELSRGVNWPPWPGSGERLLERHALDRSSARDRIRLGP
jgi:hypothetical protein